MCWRRMGQRCVFLHRQAVALWHTSNCCRGRFRWPLLITLLKSSGSSLAGEVACGGRMETPKKLWSFTPAFHFQSQLACTSSSVVTAMRRLRLWALPCRLGQAWRRPMPSKANGELHQVPVFCIEIQGSAAGRASPFWRISIEMPSGVRMKAMRPSRGGRLITTPAFCSLAQ